MSLPSCPPAGVAPALPRFRAAILDMDGLALDTESAYCHAWRQAAAEFGCELGDDFCQGLFGRHADDVERAIREVMGEAYQRREFYRSAERHWRLHLESHGVALMPGLRELLALFRRSGLPFALATNSDAPYAEECLRRAAVAPEFAVVVTRDQVARGKPAPDLFLEAARRLDTPPAACLVLEDSATGLQAARAAGTIPILIQNREALRRKLANRARLAFASLHDLAEILTDQLRAG
jgi:beta-phosphoglucomutase